MPNEKFTPKDLYSLPSPQDINEGIERILDPKMGEKEWRENWQNNTFPDLFPNLIPQLLFLPKENKKPIFRLALSTFMELPWDNKSPNAVHVAGKIFKINDNDPSLWERVLWHRKEDAKDTKSGESLVRIEIGCLLVWGKSLKEKEFAKVLIQDLYKKLNKDNAITSKARGFREHIFTIITRNNSFRRWVKINNFEQNHGFEWERNLTELDLSLAPLYQNRVPKELTSELRNFTPPTIDVFASYALHVATILPMTTGRRDDIRTFIREVESLPNDFFEGTNLSSKVKKDLEALKLVISSV